ncbi:MAG: M1 family metallopeptidase [Rhodothermales bacterium]|nr:M1 family metallopeptidase [Rhodothermales bacterium]
MRSALLLALLLATATADAQPRRPVPYPVIPSPQFQQGLAAGTRTETGRPGDAYWVNGADYTIAATIDPATRRLRGTSSVRYRNNAPDGLAEVYVHLHQNLHAPGAIRNRPQKLTDGMPVSLVRVNGADMTVSEGALRGPGYRIQGTVMQIRLAEPIPAGGEAALEFAWDFEVPEAGAPRIGTDGEIYFVGYWFPQIAVYDDVNGWKADPYMGNGEFYADWGAFDVRITLPEGWVLNATGTLQNPEEVLSAQTIERLARAARTDSIVPVVTEADRRAGVSTADSPNDLLTWHFTADQVRDFAFGASTSYLWDATSASTGGPERSLIHAFYRPGLPTWTRAAEYAKFSIEYLSKMFFPYPYAHMTTVEGVIGGGMEFPMMTHIGGARTDRSLFGVTFHEIGHMWFPMVVGQDEKAFTWMDEGLTSFNTNEAAREFWNDDTVWAPEGGYYRIAGTGREVESMRHADEYPPNSPARGIASYGKPAIALHALRGLVGQEAFTMAYREYAHRWMWKHPQPYDLFNTFEDVLGMDLDWFWTPLFFETWTLDHAILSVESTDEAVRVTVEDRGLTPMPLPVRVTYADGRTADQIVPVETWLAGERQAVLTFDAGTVVRVDIDPDQYLPDVDRVNNGWANP